MIYELLERDVGFLLWGALVFHLYSLAHSIVSRVRSQEQHLYITIDAAPGTHRRQYKYYEIYCLL